MPTRAERNIKWIEAMCRVPEGAHVAQPIQLREWQRDIIRGIYDGQTRRAIISFGRKNAKTTLSACLLLLHLVGPEAKVNSQLYSAAQSRDQAAIVHGLAAKMVRMNPDLSAYVTPRDTAKELICKELGTYYRALSAEASTAYGLSPVFVVHDELGQVSGPRSQLYDALETAGAAQEAPLSVVISTQAATDNDLLSVLIDDAKERTDSRTKLWLYTADSEAEPFDEETIRQANPAFGDFQSADEVRQQAEEARRMPSRESEYRNLILNQRIERHNPFISRGVWKQNSAEPKQDWAGLPVYGGLDLSEAADLTALVLVAPDQGEYHVAPTFWLPDYGLLEKSRADRVPYDDWHKRGYLETTPGSAISYEYIAQELAQLFEHLDIRAIAFDRWNMKHLTPWLRQAGLSEKQLEAFVDFGQGTQSMHPAMRATETALLNSQVRHGDHPVLTMCAANAVSHRNPAGWRKLEKQKSRGRIDGMVALTMALSMAVEDRGQPQTSVYETRGLVTL